MSKIYPIGRVYTIRSPNTDEVYVGSTFNPLYKRLDGHKRAYKSYKGGKHINITSIKILEAGEAYIELLEQYENLTKEQLNRYEGEYIRKTQNCINKKVAGRTIKEYRKDAREQRRIYNIGWRASNKEKVSTRLKEYNQSYYQKTKDERSIKYYCDCGSPYRLDNKNKHLKTKKHQDYVKNQLVEK